MNWDEYFLEMCKTVALRSKDISTKLGAVIVGPDHEIRATGYNSFPRGINDDVPSRQLRPEKYHWFEHAERNAIYNAARHGVALRGCILYVPWIPCSDCARGIIQVGIDEVVVSSFDIPERWEKSCTISRTLFSEGCVLLRRYNG